MSASSLPGPKVLLIGPSGAGKTTSIRTLVNLGLTAFCVFTEPGHVVIGDIPPEKLHWHYIPPASPDWSSMVKTAKLINQLSYENLTKMVDPNRAQYDQFIDLLTCFNNFKCDRTGEEFGDVCTWNTDRVLVLDGLTGAGTMSMNLHIGGKPVRSPSEWGIAQDNLERLIGKLCNELKCSFVLVAHAEREVDEVQGGVKVMAATLGKKLAPKLPRFFDDVVMAVKEADRFSWSTISAGADLKARNLPLREHLPPDYAPIFDNWKKQGGSIQPTVTRGA